MPPLQRAELTIEGDPDGDGNIETGVFVMAGNVNVTPGLRTGYVVDGRGSTINSVVSTLAGDGDSQREGIFIDLGGGAHTISLQFLGWEGAAIPIENTQGQVIGTEPVQWGDDPEPGRSMTSATAQDPLAQIDVLMKYLLSTEVDSRSPATLEYGEYSEGGLYDPLDVVIEGPEFSRSSDEGKTFTGQMTLISTRSIERLTQDLAGEDAEVPDWVDF